MPRFLGDSNGGRIRTLRAALAVVTSDLGQEDPSSTRGKRQRGPLWLQITIENKGTITLPVVTYLTFTCMFSATPYKLQWSEIAKITCVDENNSKLRAMVMLVSASVLRASTRVDPGAASGWYCTYVDDLWQVRMSVSRIPRKDMEILRSRRFEKASRAHHDCHGHGDRTRNKQVADYDKSLNNRPQQILKSSKPLEGLGEWPVPRSKAENDEFVQAWLQQTRASHHKPLGTGHERDHKPEHSKDQRRRYKREQFMLAEQSRSSTREARRRKRSRKSLQQVICFHGVNAPDSATRHRLDRSRKEDKELEELSVFFSRGTCGKETRGERREFASHEREHDAKEKRYPDIPGPCQQFEATTREQRLMTARARKLEVAQHGHNRGRAPATAQQPSLGPDLIGLSKPKQTLHPRKFKISDKEAAKMLQPKPNRLLKKQRDTQCNLGGLTIMEWWKIKRPIGGIACKKHRRSRSSEAEKTGQHRNGVKMRSALREVLDFLCQMKAKFRTGDSSCNRRAYQQNIKALLVKAWPSQATTRSMITLTFQETLGLRIWRSSYEG
ncbi:uncharacterized protein P884DRAFT_322473 [Thermothelomyces heterothallicus CBS 202.75]|uniref:uncharacterized protein n=1 Tax=Thermothelomyces heterothallicus CBS 202.75 TaxID=1149848 RepID=UPI00374237B4